MSPALKRCLKRINETKSLAELFKEYERLQPYLYDHGKPGEDRILWQAQYDRIGQV